MLKRSELDNDALWEAQRDRIIGLGECSFHKNYYPELRRSLSRLERFQALLDFVGDMVLLVALPNGQVIDANAAVAKRLGQPLPMVINRRLDELGFSRVERILKTLTQDAAKQGQTPVQCGEIVLQNPSGPLPIDVVYRVATLEGATYGVLFGRDACARVAAEARLRLAEQVFASSAEGIIVTDQRGRIFEVNRAFKKVTGYRRDEVIGKNLSFLGGGRHNPEFYRQILEALRAEDRWQGEIWSQRKNGEIYPAWLSLSVIRSKKNLPRHFIAMFSDITESKANEVRIQHMAHHDFLTGLPNRFLLNDRLEQLLASARRNQTRFAVLFVDLDRFKNINDTLGHNVGDRLLCVVSQRLSGLLRCSDTVSRQGGDEFIVLLSEIDGPSDAAHVAHKIIKALGEPYHFDGQELTVTPSIGIAIAPDDGDDSATLLKHADLAMYGVKQQGRNNFQFFHREMTHRMLELLHLETDLRQALRREEFELFYQPQIDLVSGQVVAVEALARWRHPERGLVSPVDFVPLAEETGLILPLGDWVLREACRQVAEWRRGPWPAMRVAVNLSAMQFRQADLAGRVRSALDSAGVDAEALELEVTESLLMQDIGATVQTLRALRAMGVILAIDDFGTGYSSLAYLRQFPVSTLKIDGSFVRDLVQGEGDGAICAAIIGLARNLRLDVVAEGVETEAQLNWLHSAGCSLAQGFLLGKPLPAEECAASFSMPCS